MDLPNYSRVDIIGVDLIGADLLDVDLGVSLGSAWISALLTSVWTLDLLGTGLLGVDLLCVDLGVDLHCDHVSSTIGNRAETSDRGRQPKRTRRVPQITSQVALNGRKTMMLEFPDSKKSRFSDVIWC